jgi:acetyl esterase
VLHVFAPLFWRPRKTLYFATHAIAAPLEVRVPTRHGAVRCLIYRPPADARDAGDPPPVHVQIHGGGFYGRLPEQDEHIAGYIAADVGAVVVSIDYDVAPHVQYPVAEEECYDVAAWVVANAVEYGWDAQRLSVGGESAGGKLAINVCQLAHASGAFRPRALIATYAVADIARADGTWLQRLLHATYFADASRRSEPVASPYDDAELAAALPATLIVTAAGDALATQMDQLAARLLAAGVSVVHRRFAATGHGFTHTGPVAAAREAIGLMGDLLRDAFAR